MVASAQEHRADTAIRRLGELRAFALDLYGTLTLGGLLSESAEAGLIYLVLTKTKGADDRTILLWILFMVGVHFVPMGLAHGPVITALGVLTMVNALGAAVRSAAAGVRGDRRAAEARLRRGDVARVSGADHFLIRSFRGRAYGRGPWDLRPCLVRGGVAHDVREGPPPVEVVEPQSRERG
ncbi:DUF6609 family protein [Nonomuraea basaltis]|uniref:DUF6609 family protein n=1 Tax=Nonomuraea basaltis TaxID=2495887 RepID=UPI00110C588D|nr:DUF6609 family protein [Nonomuraea basaltis]TMS00294.1 hypothetical protein EJK15_02605 [Nonomuraea basaltis]